MSAAAVSLALLGGATIASTQFGSGNDSVANDASRGDDAVALATEEAPADAAGAANAEATPGVEGESMLEDSAALESGADDSMEDAAGMADAEAELEESSDVGPAALDADEQATSATTTPASDESVESGIFIESFPANTRAFEVHEALGSNGFPIEESLCGSLIPAPRDQSGALTTAASFFPLLLGNQDAELIVYGPGIAVLVASDGCEIITN